jgi:hypothetical protein
MSINRLVSTGCAAYGAAAASSVSKRRLLAYRVNPKMVQPLAVTRRVASPHPQEGGAMSYSKIAALSVSALLMAGCATNEGENGTDAQGSTTTMSAPANDTSVGTTTTTDPTTGTTPTNTTMDPGNQVDATTLPPGTTTTTTTTDPTTNTGVGNETNTTTPPPQ